MRKIFILLVSALSVYAGLGQPTASLPSIIPASPEPAAMARASNMDVSLCTGMASVNIPLYEMKMGKYSLPISVGYASNGLKVDDIPSRVGLGWSLSAGGVITRTVRGRADDKTTRKESPGFNPTLQQLCSYYDNIANGTYDAEPDEYSISAPGLSGKFILDSNNQAVKIPYNNNKIQVTMNATELKVLITDANGVQYYFGYDGKVEKTMSHNVGGKNAGLQVLITSMFLTKIQYPNGSFINFNYQPINYDVVSGINQSLQTGLQTNTAPANLCNCGGGLGVIQCPVGPQAFQSSVTDIVYNSYYLSSIQSSDFQNILFSYESREDNSGDKRLKSISILAGGFSKAFNFKYLTPVPAVVGGVTNSLSTVNKTFFLTEISWLLPINGILTDTSRYTFSYDNLASLPPRLNTGQDNMGYYNAAGNPYLLPSMPNTSTENWGSIYASADRNPNPSAARIGMLTRVTYPTGGYQEFDYESNKFAKYELINTTLTSSVTGSGNSSQSGTYTSLTYYSNNFLIKRDQSAHVSLSAFANPGCSNCSPPPPNTVTFVTFDVINTNTNTSVWTEIMRDYNSLNFDVSLLANQTYKLKLTVSGLPNASLATIRYDTSANPIYAWVNYNASGLRVKSIRSFDPVSAKSTNRYLFYNTTLQSNISSAKYLFQPDYITETHIVQLCQSDLPPNDLSSCRTAFGETQYKTTTCKSKILSSNSSFTNYNFDGSNLVYETVYESDDAAFLNGYIEHKYIAYPISNVTTIQGYANKGVPVSTTTTLNTFEKETNVFSKTNSLVRKQLNYYSYDGLDYDKRVTATSVNKKYTSQIIDWLNTYVMLDPYDVNQYDYLSNWLQLDSTVTIDYDANGNSLTMKSINIYGSPVNIQPVSTKSYASTGDVITTNLKYPTDYAVAPYVNMVSKNIISPTVETSQTRNSLNISLVRANYREWYNAGSIFIAEPETIVTRKGSNAEEPRIRYYSYDLLGNPLSVSKENGAKIAYIWDYNSVFPVAELKNACVGVDSFAYTSFEAGGKGYWQYAGAPTSQSFQPTGSYSYRLSSGSISRSVSTSKGYYVTYWLKDASGTVSVNGTTAKTLISRNGWTCYQHLVQGVSLVTLSGTGTVDELRLYPLGSYLTSFTYRTYVGISSRNEPNNQITYYEYDDANRLLVARDMDRNIIKQNDYQYKKQIFPCSSTTANWVITGALKCVKTSEQNNNNTGEQQREERDMNNCSPTYLQTRWVSIGVTGQCPPVANCSGADKRVVNGVCETGVKTLVSSVQISANQWQCTYHYVWSDSYVGPNFTETSSTNCLVGGGGI